MSPEQRERLDDDYDAKSIAQILVDYADRHSFVPLSIASSTEILLARALLAALAQGPAMAYTNGSEIILAAHWTADVPPDGWIALYGGKE